MNDQSTPHHEQLDLIRQVLTFPSKLRHVSFASLVKQSTGFDVIRMDLTNDYDKYLISNLKQKLLGSLRAIEKSGQYFRGNRINDVGSQIETYFVHDLSTPPFNVRQLTQKGYPDIEITFNDESVYVELKTSGVKESSYRYFYYSTGSKIKKTSRHILLSILADSTDRGYWTVKSFIISDLSRLEVKLKAEFNASQRFNERRI